MQLFYFSIVFMSAEDALVFVVVTETSAAMFSCVLQNMFSVLRGYDSLYHNAVFTGLEDILDMSFSLVGKPGTMSLHVVCGSKEECEFWFRGIQGLVRAVHSIFI